MGDIGLFGAFLGGIMSLFSPCSALLLPAFFAYAFKTKTQLLARTGLFLVGMLIVLTPIGFGAGGLGSFFTENRGILILIGGIVIIAMGVITLVGGGFKVPFLSKLNGKTGGSTLLLGMVYGFSGFCAGPLLGAVLATAVIGGNPIYGAITFALYGLGMTIPLFVLALLWERFNIGKVKWLRSRWFTIASGLLFIVIGGLFIVSYGAANLPTLMNDDQQVEVQNSVLDFSHSVNNMVFVLIIIALAIIGILIYILRTGGFKQKEQDKTQDATD